MDTQVWDMIKGFGSAAPFVGLLLYLLRDERKGRSDDRVEFQKERESWQEERKDLQKDSTDMLKDSVSLGVALRLLLERIVAKVGA